MELYPTFPLERQRALCSQGRQRGVVIYPPPLPPPPPEVVHRQSTIVPLPHNTRQVMVVEWTGDNDRHLHLVNVDAL